MMAHMRDTRRLLATQNLVKSPSLITCESPNINDALIRVLLSPLVSLAPVTFLLWYWSATVPATVCQPRQVRTHN